MREIRIADPNGEDYKVIKVPEAGQSPMSYEDQLIIRLRYKLDYLESKAIANRSKNSWRELVVGACKRRGMEFDYDKDPSETLRILIKKEVVAALDPSKSPEAQKLVNKGYAMGFSETKPGSITNFGSLTDFHNLK